MTQITRRTQFLCCAIAKRVFLHEIWGVTMVRDGLRLDDAKAIGLQPLLLYAVSVPETDLRHILLSPVTNPVALSEFLTTAWNNPEFGLGGFPDELVMTAPLVEADYGLVSTLEAAGVQVTVPEKGSKQHPAALRVAQDELLYAGWRAGRKDEGGLWTLSAFNENMNRRMFISATHPGSHRPPRVRERTAAHLTLPYRQWTGSLTGKMDWLDQSWLSSWQSTLPPMVALWRIHEGAVTWLTDSEPESGGVIVARQEETDDTKDGHYELDVDQDLLDTLRPLIACWPNGKGELAAHVGVTGRQLDWFLQGRTALTDDVLGQLIDALGVDTDRYGYWSPGGGRAFVARGRTLTRECYEQLSFGGDLQLAFEVIPASGPADLAWRFVVLKAHGGSLHIMAFVRGCREAELVDGGKLINLVDPQRIEKGMYRDIVAAMREASVAVTANAPAIALLEARHGAALAAMEDPY